MGVVGIYIHGLKDNKGYTSRQGSNPFDYINFDSFRKLSQIVKCCDLYGDNSREKYAWISKHLANAVEEAIQIRRKYS